MKTLLFYILTIGLFFQLSAQVAIGKDTVDGDGLLDFVSGTTRGIILPNITDITTMTNVSEGTLVYDLATSKVMYYNGIWNDLSLTTGVSPTPNAGTDVGEGVIVGAHSSSAEGALVLEASDKALILPKVSDPHVNVKSPVAGMICYDTLNKTFSVYDGQRWSFWK